MISANPRLCAAASFRRLFQGGPIRTFSDPRHKRADQDKGHHRDDQDHTFGFNEAICGTRSTPRAANIYERTCFTAKVEKAIQPTT
jgi:hypothetical protein